jgi:predicted ATPase
MIKMTENEIILLHDRLYEYLKTRHQSKPSFLFWSRYPDWHPLFKKGYWFSGDESYLETTVWDDCGDAYLYTCLLKYHFDTLKWDCRINLNKPPIELIQQVEALGFLRINFFHWEKQLSSGNDFLTSLAHFMDIEKPLIDAHLKKNINNTGIKEFETKLQNIETEKKLGFVKERYRLLYNSMPHLPFALSRIEIIDFQGIKHLIIQNIPLDTQWIFLTGENGYGKTSVLRAIAKGLVGDEDLVASLPQETRIYINGYNWNQPFFYSARSKTIANNNFQVAMYGASRFRYHDDADKSKQKTFFLFSDEGKLTNIERVLITAERVKDREKKQKKETTFDKLKKIFLHIIPQLADIKVEYIENELLTDREQVFYYEKGARNEIFEPVRLEALAAGYRGILTMIGDMMIRLSKDPNNSLDDLQGIVLIDEIDAHLHPKYQYDLPRLLSEMFPKIQFIATTHSPIPLLSVPKNKSIVLTVERNLEKGITVDRKDDVIDIHSLNPNALLTSPIFGFHHLFAVDADVDDIAPVDNYKEVETMDKIKERLKRLRERGLIQ